MSDEISETEPPLPNLHFDSIVCRLAKTSRWINPDDQRQLIPEAFFRRRIEKGLSVNIEYACEVAFILNMVNDDPPYKAHGKAEMQVGAIRASKYPLDVIPDSPTHADIVGMPIEEDDPKLARDIAHELAEMATVTWIRPKGTQK